MFLTELFPIIIIPNSLCVFFSKKLFIMFSSVIICFDIKSVVIIRYKQISLMINLKTSEINLKSLLLTPIKTRVFYIWIPRFSHCKNPGLFPAKIRVFQVLSLCVFKFISKDFCFISCGFIYQVLALVPVCILCSLFHLYHQVFLSVSIITFIALFLVSEK